MPEGVRVDPLLDVRLLCQPAQQLAHIRRIEWRPVERAEQRPGPDAQLRAPVDPAVDDGHRPRSIPTTRARSPLPWRTRIVPARESTSAGFSAKGLAEAQAAPVQDNQERAVADSGGARLDDARIRLRASAAVTISGGKVRPLFGGAIPA
jgi:hypothetical protein